jgi:hypothetical protein
LKDLKLYENREYIYCGAGQKSLSFLNPERIPPFGGSKESTAMRDRLGPS